MFEIRKDQKELWLITLPSLIFGLIFAVNNWMIIPYIAGHSTVNPYIIAQIVHTLLLFIPIFIVAVLYLRDELPHWQWTYIKERATIKKITLKDLGVMLAALTVSIIVVGLIVLLVNWLPLPEEVKKLESISPVVLRPFSGMEFLFLLAMPVIFFFNFVGEELLWRGVLFQ